MKRTTMRMLAVSALALVVLIGALALLSRLMVPKNNQTSFGQIDATAMGVLGEPKNTLDVLFMGDSEVYTSIDPLSMWREYGFTSYDVSTSAQPLPYTRSLLTRALERQAPRLVVLETNMLFRKVTMEDALWRQVAEVFPVLEYHNRWKSLKSIDISAEPKATWTDPNKGFCPRDSVVPSSVQNHMKPTDKAAEIPRLNQFYLDRIIALCQERDIPVLLLSTPSTINWNAKRHNAVENYLKAHTEFTNVAYLDLNLEEGLDIDWALDTCDGGDHLNQQGANKVTTFVGTWLTEHYSLPDHREGANYHS
ncbi:MAG TPA: SGNH/GDSL hydrolase family protein [Candidatus Limicola stercorigallinarum]|nr:SGNH/GDSL hydrolase family protein [Candidatus Limicola stercorigallinarum]